MTLPKQIRQEISDGSTATTGVESIEDGGTSFSMNLGSGVVYKLNDRLSLCLFQFDYNPIFLRRRTIDSPIFPDRTLNGARIADVLGGGSSGNRLDSSKYNKALERITA
jgi:hypothetical protein